MSWFCFSPLLSSAHSLCMVSIVHILLKLESSVSSFATVWVLAWKAALDDHFQKFIDSNSPFRYYCTPHTHPLREEVKSCQFQLLSSDWPAMLSVNSNRQF